MGSLGRRLRNDKIDGNGLNTSCGIIIGELNSLIGYDSDSDDHIEPKLKDDFIVEFSNGVSLYTHLDTAPEETLFLYREIFLWNVYLRNNIVIRENDIIFDIGANVGFFSVFCGLLVPSVKIVAIEPVSINFDKLEANLLKYSLNSLRLKLAIGIARDENKVDKVRLAISLYIILTRLQWFITLAYPEIHLF